MAIGLRDLIAKRFLESVAYAALLLAVAAQTLLPSMAQGQTATGASGAQFEEVLQNRADELGLNRVEVVIFNSQGIIEQYAIGESGDYLVGTVTETLTAIAVMQLVEQGQWSLFDNVAQRLPGIALENPYAAESPLLLWHLLEHSSGLDQRRFKSHSAGAGATKSPLLERIQREQDPLQVRWPPGAAASPSAINYALLGAMLEHHYGQPWQQIITEQVTAPLGLTVDPLEPPVDAMPAGHQGLPPKAVAATSRMFAEAEGAWLTADDLVKIGQFFLSGGATSTTAVLRRDTIENMQRPRSTDAADAGLAYGYASGLDTRANHGLWLGRQSSLAGYGAQLRYAPERDIGYVIVLDHQTLLPAIEGLLWNHRLPAHLPAPLVAGGGVSIEPRWQGWYRLVNSEHAWLAPLERVVNLAYVTQENADLRVREGLKPTLALRSVDGSRLVRPNDNTPIGLLFSDQAGAQRLQVYHDVRERVEPWRALLPLLALIIALLWLFSSVAVPARYWPVLQARRFTIAAAWFLLLSIFVAGSLSLEQASTDNWRSVLLFCLTLLFPLCTLAALVTMLTYGWKCARKNTLGWATWGTAYSLLAVVAGAGIAVWFVHNGWFALRTWAW